MPRGGRNVPGLQERWALKGKLLPLIRRGQLHVQAWPKPFGPARSQAQKDTQVAFARFQRAAKFFPPDLTIQAMTVTQGTGMYPRDLLLAAALGTNVMLGYDQLGAQPMLGDGLQKFVAVGGESSVDFPAIPPGYSALRLFGMGRSTAATTFMNATLQYNGGGGGNYDWALWWSPGPTSAFNAPGATCGHFTGASCPAGYPSLFDLFIPNYSSTSFFKVGQQRGAHMTALSNTNLLNEFWMHYWRSMAAVSRITLTFDGPLAAGSTFTLQGLF